MSIRDPLQDRATITVELYGLDRIVDQLELIGLACGRIADSLPIPFVVESSGSKGPPELLRNPNLHLALVLVREILDSDGSVASGRKLLFDAEALLSAELGQPIWEGRRE